MRYSHNTSEVLNDPPVFYVFNARSVINKIDAFRSFVHVFRPSIVAVTESWANDNIPDHFLCPSHYQIFRQDRTLTVGGGVFLIVHESLNPLAVEFSFDAALASFINCAWCSVILRNFRCIVGCIYRSPSSPKQIDCLLVEHINQVFANDECHYRILTGDFNLPDIDWSLNLGSPSSAIFRDCFADNFLTQVVTVPTRGGNILDLFLINDVTLVSSISVDECLLGSDHRSVSIRLLGKAGLPKNSSKSSSAHFDYSKANWSLYRTLLQDFNWDLVFSSNDCNTIWNNFQKVISETASRAIPLLKKKHFVRGVLCTGEVKRAHRARKRVYQKTNGLQTAFALNLRTSADSRLANALSVARTSFEKKVAENARNNPKLFWGTIRSQLACKHKLIGVLKADGILTSTPEETAECLNDFFASVYTRECTSNIPGIDPKTTLKIDHVAFSEDVVHKTVSDLPISRSPGPDGITYLLVKQGGPILTRNCAQLFSTFCSMRSLPDEWKKSLVVPIYKGSGTMTAFENYRPISLTCVLCKLMEKIIKSTLQTYLLENELLYYTQHGFLPGRSTQTALLEYLEFVTYSLDQKRCVDSVYLDFKKAFDSVPHQRLLRKLQRFGIHGDLFYLLKSFLSDRSQCVVVNGKHSSWSRVLSGVPQGSVLGPLLFLMYIDDLDDVIEDSGLLKFADDVRIFIHYDSHSLTNPSSPLTDDLTRISDWCIKWQMSLNLTKCQCIHFGSDNPCLPSFVQHAELPTNNSVRDLGVLLSSDLKPSVQCSLAAKKAQKMLVLIRLSFKLLDVHVLSRLYKSFVRPLLEYCATAWCPYYLRDISALEKVQRRATRMIPSLRQFSYIERLRHFSMTTLSTRRLRYDLITVYKIVHSQLLLNPDLFFHQKTLDCTRGHHNKFFVNYSRLELRRNFFSNRVVSSWNSLPESCVTASSVLVFKCLLDKHLRDEGFV